MLRDVDRDIWVAEQPFRYFGLSIGTRMTVIRLDNQELVVISPIQITNELSSQLEELGTVQHIIAPNLYHYLFAADFKAAYPHATFWAVPGLETKQPNLAIDQIIPQNGNSPWNGLESVMLDGFRTVGVARFDDLNECVLFHAASRTLILTDTAFNFDESFPLITQLATRIVGSYNTLSPSLLEQVATHDKQAVKAAVERVLRWDFERVIVAHGSIVEQNGKERFKQGYERFLGQTLGAAV
ncbi:DUF4336 domain-containing protein [Leptolyngbya sp. AN02str]|uniref:DUF4336 domain-containing protein n=1 Tax=Leptolyngbya sp. AN02str TaxID=3423363 RepID=UPI003D3234D6